MRSVPVANNNGRQAAKVVLTTVPKRCKKVRRCLTALYLTLHNCTKCSQVKFWKTSRQPVKIFVPLAALQEG